MWFKCILILNHYLKIETFLIKLYLNWAKSLLVLGKSIHSLVCVSLKVCHLLDFSFLKAKRKSMFYLFFLPPPLSCCRPILIKVEICCLGDQCWEINVHSSSVMSSYAGALFLCKMLHKTKEDTQSICDIFILIFPCDKIIYLCICIIWI